MTIPSSVTKTENNAFRGCHNLTSVIYEGTNDPGSDSSNIFDSCESLSFICVPDDYNDTSFSSITALARGTHQCDELHASVNHCYGVVEENNVLVVRQRANVSLWENQTNGCVKYYCDNETGGMIRTLCKSNEMCMNDECIPNEVLNDWNYVVLDFGNESDIRETDVSVFIQRINDLVDFEVNIAVEINEEGYNTRIIINVEEEEEVNVVLTVFTEHADDPELLLSRKAKISSHTRTKERVLSFSLGTRHLRLTCFPLLLCFLCLLPLF